MIDVTIKITKEGKSIEINLAELQDLHAQIEGLSSVAKFEEYKDSEDW